MDEIDKYIDHWRLQGITSIKIGPNKAEINLFMTEIHVSVHQNMVQITYDASRLLPAYSIDINNSIKSKLAIQDFTKMIQVREKNLGYTFNIYEYQIENISTDNLVIDNVDTSKNQLAKFKYLLTILPKDTRQEFIADLQSIIKEMKNDNCSKSYIHFILLIHITSVIYHAVFFKLKNYFYRDKQQSNH